MTDNRPSSRCYVMQRLVLAMLIALAASPLVIYAQSAQRGRLTGSVRGTSGESLAGVTVTVTSSALQGQRATTTEANGSYVLRDLPPGNYNALFELGDLPSVDRPVVIELGRTSRAEAVLGLATFEDEVVVEGNAPTPLAKTQVGLNLNREVVDKLPVGRTPVETALLAPGVNESLGYPYQVKISGGYAYDNVFLVEGADVADQYGSPVAGVTTLTGPFIEDAIEETQVLTSAISAEYGRFGGGVVNLITRSGGNAFEGSFRIDLSDPSWRDETPIEKELGLVREGNRSQVFSATLGGPIVEDKLWFFIAGRQTDESQPSVMAISGAPRPSDFDEQRYQVKLTANLADRHSLQGTWIDAELDGFIAFEWVIDPNAASPFAIPNDLLVLRYSGVLTPRLLVEGQVSRRNFAFGKLGSSGRDTSDPRNSPFLTLSEEWLYNHPDGNYGEDPDALESQLVAASVSWFAAGDRVGSHDIKLGIERFDDANIWGGSISPTGRYFFADYLVDVEGRPAYDAQGRFQPLFDPFGVFLLDRQAVIGARGEFETISLYANDRWTLDERWTFNLGLRYESVSGSGTPGIETVDTDVLVPRLAVSLDPKGDGVFRLGASYSEYPGKYSHLQFDDFTDLSGAGAIFYMYTGPPGAGVDFSPGFDLDNYIVVGASSRESNLLASGVGSALSKEWTLSVGMQLPRGGYVEATLVDRETTDILEDFITIDNGTTTLEFPGLTIEADNRLLRNSDINRREYQALQAYGRYQVTDLWTIDGNWTYQLTNHGNSDSESGFSGIWDPLRLGDYPEILVPERNVPYGRLRDYQRHRVRLWTNYEVPLEGAGDLGFALLYRYDSPRTYSLVASNVELTPGQVARDPGYALPPESQDVYFGRRGSQEFDDSHVFDLAVRYSVPAWKSLEPWLRLEVRNVFNDVSTVSWGRTVRPDFEGAVDEHGIWTEYIEGPGFGQARSPDDFVTPREFLLSFGLRF